MDKKYQKKVLFLGMPDMALVCLSKLVYDGFNIVGVVPPHRSDGTYELMCNFVRGLKLPLVEYQNKLDELDFLHKIRQLEADIAVVCSYNKKFPPELLKIVKGGFVNCHPSLLPDYRGANPYSNVIINDEAEKLGFNKDCSYHFSLNSEAIDCLNNILEKDDKVLIKASNSLNFKEIVDAIK